jgi:hypothetical protein
MAYGPGDPAPGLLPHRPDSADHLFDRNVPVPVAPEAQEKKRKLPKQK